MGSRENRIGWLLLLLLCSACQRAAPPAPRPLRVAAAADVERAFVALSQQFTAGSGQKIVFSFSSSGVLAQQIGQGAPFDLFASANGELVERLRARGRLVPGSQHSYARGRLVLWARPGAPLPQTLAQLAAPTFARIALANPEHAPYGQAAVQALRAAGVYEPLRGRLVFGENVRQAQQFAATGNADVALTALSLVQGGPGTYVEVPEALHAPLVQVLAVIRGGDEAGGERLAAYICGPAGQAILRAHGFLPPTIRP